MKQGHWMLLFLLLYLSCFLYLYCEQVAYDSTIEEKQKLEQALLDAIECAGNDFCAVLYDSEEEKKRVLEQSFSEAFYVLTGLLDTAEERGYWRMYFPMLVLIEEDGVWFCYTEETEQNGSKMLLHQWKEKIAFSFETENTEEKRAAIAEILEENAAKIINDHNFLAAQYGISYQYYVPRFLQDTSGELEFPMLFVVFQGWPLKASEDIYYDNCMDAGVFLRRIEQNGYPEDKMSIYMPWSMEKL